MDDTFSGAVDRRWEYLLAFPAVLLLAWGIQASPLIHLFMGLTIWVHELGHATVAWLCGYRALPLPIGWTNVEETKSLFVYGGIVFLLALFAYTCWREGKRLPAFLAVLLLALQAYMTWLLPESDYRLWNYWAGIGGEYYLGALAMVAFFMEMPQKFRWGVCKYIFLLIGAVTFWRVYFFWQAVAAGEELIPWGTLLHGDGDMGGDMDYLAAVGWSNADIISRYDTLGQWCVIVVMLVYVGCNVWVWVKKEE